MAKMGAPTKFPDDLHLVKFLAEKGFTDKEMAKALKVTEQTFNNWKIANPQFFESLKDWKKNADRKVERSLYERACGYEHPEDKIFCSNGEIVTESTIKKYPPDATSMIFWLKNRQPDKWREKTEVEVSAARSLIDEIREEMNKES